jgi:regulatory protein
MATITKLTVQKKDKERISVYLDGEFAFGLTAAAGAGLRTGQELTEADIAALQDKEQYEKAKRGAIDLISRRPRSTTEIAQNLRRKEVPEVVIERVIVRLTELELLNDATFAAFWVEQREAFKPRSRLALGQELRQKGISRELIDEALQDFDETAAAQQAALKQARQWSHLPEQEFRNKLGAYLQRRGFSYDAVREVIEMTWQEVGEA